MTLDMEGNAQLKMVINTNTKIWGVENPLQKRTNWLPILLSYPSHS